MRVLDLHSSFYGSCHIREVVCVWGGGGGRGEAVTMSNFEGNSIFDLIS